MFDGYTTGNTCPKCNMPYTSGGCGCPLFRHEKPAGLQGWVCPVCGRGLSPFTQFCPCKGYPEMKVTCGGTI